MSVTNVGIAFRFIYPSYLICFYSKLVCAVIIINDRPIAGHSQSTKVVTGILRL